MRARAKTWVGFVRGRSLVAFGVYCVGVVISTWWSHLDLVSSPFFDQRATIVLAWASCLPAIVALGALPSPNADMERSYPQRTIGRYRAAWLAILLILAPAYFSIVAGIQGQGIWAIAWFFRNHLLLLGLGALTMLVLPTIAGLMVPTAYVLACWFMGSVDALGTAARWALPIYPPDTIWVSVAAGCLAVTALVGHYYRPCAANWQ